MTNKCPVDIIFYFLGRGNLTILQGHPVYMVEEDRDQFVVHDDNE